MEKVTNTGRYPVAADGSLAPKDTPKGAVFEWTGEHRPPKAGEWFLSGAVVEAYYAANNQTAPMHIAKLVRTVQLIVTAELWDEETPEEFRDHVRRRMTHACDVDLAG